jgi:hypothetical protein
MANSPGTPPEDLHESSGHVGRADPQPDTGRLGPLLQSPEHLDARPPSCVSLKARIAFLLISKLYRQMYANTGIATDSARVNRFISALYDGARRNAVQINVRVP